MKELYVVKMNRFGDEEMHSYIVGVYEKKHQAQKNGIAEEYWRGGKYKAEIHKYGLNQEDEEVVQYMVKKCGGMQQKDVYSIKIIKHI